ncbi:MAG: hypothetical protein JWN86_4093 [Planctomycetota bacterium]|nr:hypothetical protein [Planctomycetota bacterium]
MPRPGQRDYSAARLTRHAVERFVERLGVAPEEAETALRAALKRTRRLGRNPENGAVAVLAVDRGKILVAIFQDESLLTVLTWPQFEPSLPEFGRAHLPRKRGRMIRRLTDDPSEQDPSPSDPPYPA